jgi:mono/diheme cytochrome c family protein
MSRVNLEIALGVLLVFFTGVFVVIYGFREPQRMQEFEKHQSAQAIEVGADLFDANCTGCHGPQGEGIPGVCPPLNDRYFFDQRMKEVNWSGTLEDYIVSTVSSGRLASTRPQFYAGRGGSPAMPAFSDQYGGPLRVDQIRSIAAFVVNWQETAPDRGTPAPMSGPPVGTDITVELPEGVPTNGETLATAKGCVVCHVSTATGPAWQPTADTPGIGDRAVTRPTVSDYTGAAKSPQQYLLESIVSPNVYVVPGFSPSIMPQSYGDTLTAQEAADLIAYMLTIK